RLIGINFFLLLSQIRLRDMIGVRFQIHVLGELGMIFELLTIGLTDNGPAFHRAMFLGAGNFVALAGFGKLGAKSKMFRFRGAQQLGVIQADLVTDTARATGMGFLPSVSE